MMELPPAYRKMVQEIAEDRSREIDGRTGKVSMAEAIRYAIADTWTRLQEKGTTDES